jgi:hypothetical protein
VLGEDYGLSLLSGEDYALSLLRLKSKAERAAAEILSLQQLGGRSNRMALFKTTVRLFAKFTWGVEEHTLRPTLAEIIAHEAIHLRRRRIRHLKDVLGPMVWGYTGTTLAWWSDRTGCYTPSGESAAGAVLFAGAATPHSLTGTGSSLGTAGNSLP